MRISEFIEKLQMNSKDYVFEMYLDKLEARVKEVRELYNNRDNLGSIDEVKRAFNNVHSGLSDALASVLESLDTLKESFNG
ncbi:hypothetical protein HPMG_01181 [Helicobacter pullorum MIT 98-5489]|uniref:Uncharacterized protein n=2 Tax=Helicobacter pullorum TaxID=35818 RepID=A0A0N0LTP3_9HELI|nr:hypothetical protein [Helicobacter pullorum]EAL0720660.1 hypothetical protein [Campylobacter jejuni]EEQ63724.1 hypothetical protein HPMG_01181 [Helicobacter pullorum MIT 98-5489]KPH53966.1 hypothetical protein HPU229334_00770 [Helicobacter pullorum]KPH55459.1 hypothetical protein HPU229334_08420 [Helicobacter pullorum]